MLQTGDRIICDSDEEAIEIMHKLSKGGIETDFDYTDGIALVITKGEI